MARKINPVLPGWTPLRNKKRQYRSPSGKVVPRRQYEDARVKQFGWDSWHDYQKTKLKDDVWLRDQGMFVHDQTENKGNPITKRDLGPDSEFAKRYVAMRNDKRTYKGPKGRVAKNEISETSSISGDFDRSPDGPTADYLVYIGRRQPEDYWDVGDTPTK